MMFGRPPAPQVNWEGMYFYQRVHHLVDHAADWMVSRLDWWLPSIAAGMALSLLILSGDPIAEGGAMVLPTLSPVVRTPSFGLQLPEREGQAPEEEEEEF
ncbi:putative variant surface glycoprotein [Trypanosoma theileri]|uniref:Putative variant surface glycoprotein n=1 Tax=Trypanosoma theileri TaxID=67003 RepID=A0A1X0P0Q4_9TRYP|nr:putative variant surface glycoprotein [Trypanosoma theileri]ORC90485.1 putative variant surface glycoprotein [Trypanosoma theileri]